jgi:hypothetical protein
MKITTVVATNQIMLEASLYHSTTIHHKVTLPFAAITNFKSIHELLTHHVSQQIAGRCITEGFVKPQSCSIRSQSVGTMSAGTIGFNLEIDCMMCCPKEGDVMKCVAKTVTQAGIRAHACTEPSPVVIYISRELQDSQSRTMDSVKPGDHILIRVIGKRYELNDKHVSIIGEWIFI